MSFHLMPAGELSADELQAWSQIQRETPELADPFFRPEFTQAMATVRDDVEVAVLRENDRPVLFFPFQRQRERRGLPVGGPLSNRHGAIASPQTEWSLDELMRACRLARWDFDQLPVAQPQFGAHHWTCRESRYLDLSNGFDAYIERRRRHVAKHIAKIFSRRRKLEQEIGPVRLERHTPDRELLQRMIEWKSAQYRQSRLFDVFSLDWTKQLLELLLDHSTGELETVLSVLFVADEPAAISLGLQSGRTFHGWFTSYDRRFATFGPGILLMLELARALAETGTHRLELGAGKESYKKRLASAAVPVAKGSVVRDRIARSFHRRWYETCEWASSTRLRKPALMPVRWLRSIRDHRAFQ